VRQRVIGEIPNHDLDIRVIGADLIDNMIRDAMRIRFVAARAAQHKQYLFHSPERTSRKFSHG
jgi:hypothetical protein